MNDDEAPQSIPPDSPDLEGKLVAGKYRVRRLVGTGGMGTVWEGYHEGLHTKVAIKFIRPQFAAAKDARRRFEIEARAAAKLQSKHAVQVFDYGVTEDGLPYIVMEYLEGESLSEALIRGGPMQASEVAKVIGQAARALTKAHAAGIVHRDLKPDNIFLADITEDTKLELPYTVKLVDFGIAKMFDEPLRGDTKPTPMGGPTQEGAVIGTPNFMAPEQLTVGGAPTPLTDLWSLGACAFAAMTARIPFEGEVLGDIVLKVCAAPLPVPSKINPNVPAGFDAWFARACNRDATKRFQTATELAESLANVCGTGRVRVATFSEDQVQYSLKAVDADAQAAADEIEVPKSMSPKTALAAGLVLGVTLVIGFVGAIAWRDKQLADDELMRSLSTTPSVSATAPRTAATPPSATAPPSTMPSSSAPVSTVRPATTRSATTPSSAPSSSASSASVPSVPPSSTSTPPASPSSDAGF